MKNVLVAVLFLGNVVVACEDGDSPSTCVPGATVSCPCGVGAGTQTCLPNGTFDPCDCPPECEKDTDCPTLRPFCTPALTCVECRNDSDCPTNRPSCDEVAGICQVDKGTGGNGGSGGEGGSGGGGAGGIGGTGGVGGTGSGGTGGEGGKGGDGSWPCVPGTTVSCQCGDETGIQTCLSDGTFGPCDCPVECQRNTDCPTGRPFCIDGVCSECTAHPDCPASRPICTPALICAECRSSSDCPVDRPFCDEDAGACVECFANTDCHAGAPICNGAAGTCHVCLANTDCPAEQPRCSSATTCEECLDSGDCPAARPYCSGEAACVECLGSEDCNGGTCIDGVCNPCILISPDDLDFGTVKPECSSRAREIRIVNICESTLVFDRIELSSVDSDEFSITKEPTPGALPAGGYTSFTMVYRPTNEGLDLGSVLVFVQNVTEPYMAALRGRGANDATQTDTFAQGERQKVDVLWVIDNSGSMGEEQAILANDLESFLSFAIDQQIDFQIGVTTTGLTPASASCPGGASGGEDGRLFPIDGSRPRIITPNTTNMAEVWSNNFRVGTCHSVEKPLEAAYRALTPPVIDHDDDPRHSEPNDGNRGFLREDAHLAIITVTDEADQSPQTVDFYHKELQSIKGFQNRHLFSFHAITGDPGTGCNSNGSAQSGDKLIAMVERTGGVFQSICASNWAESLRIMSLAAFGYKDCFYLGNAPEDTNENGVVSDEDGEILVKVDGHLLGSSSTPGEAIWSYNAARNAVCFDARAVPEPGAKIEISYRVACGSGETGGSGGDPFAASMIAAGYNHTCALTTDGDVRCWGDNSYGQLGGGTISSRSATPVAVANLSNATAITAGLNHTCALTTDGDARCWGANSYGQLGDGTAWINSATPVAVTSLSNATAITAGHNHTCALTTDGDVRCWGNNSSDQLGDGTTVTRSSTPVAVTSLSNTTAITAGGQHTCALTTDGDVWCWGYNYFGQLGDGTTLTRSAAPVAVTSLSNATAITAGGLHTCAPTTSGNLRCWGANSSGQLGDATWNKSATPVAVTNLSNATAIAAGYTHTCALTTDGDVRCWGANSSGQLGDGTRSNSATPVAVTNLSNATAIAPGHYHTCAVKTDGAVWCWGKNLYGQLGDGTTVDATTPVEVNGTGGDT